MSSRPRQPSMARVNKARSRMAPGGLMWSESPIPRPGKRRVRRLGTPPTPPTYVSGSTLAFSGTDAAMTSTGLTVGDVMTCVAITKGAAITPPSGWVTLVSGAVTDLNYWAGWITLAGSDDLTLVRANTTYAALGQYHRWTDAVATPTAAAGVESSAVSSVALEVPGGVMGSQYVGVITTGTNYMKTTASDGFTDFDTYWGFRSGGPDIELWGSWADQSEGGAHPGTYSNYSDSGRTTPKNVLEAVTFAFGWV